VDKKGWLVNDCLTCIPGTKTFWHDLLEWFPCIVDKTNTYTPFDRLADCIESEATKQGVPDFIIRNATFFRKINLKTKTISFLQDYYPEWRVHNLQIDVCNNSDVVVFNSPFTESIYKEEIKIRTEVIPIGTDFDLFRPLDNKDELRSKWNIPKDCILFIGSTNNVKGFSIIESLINNTNYNFCLVMKDNYTTERKNVKVFNKVNHQQLVEIINCCVMLICTSVRETLHLSGIEAAACGVPVLTTNVGIYYNRESGKWGTQVSGNNFVDGIKRTFKNIDTFSPREYFLKEGLDKDGCKRKWGNLL
jgi:glycosyltransferase involved in cell wall biosynthesis